MRGDIIHKALVTLGNAVYRPDDPVYISEKEIYNFIRNATVVLPSGGEGSRLKGYTTSDRVHKTVYPLPNNQTMIERTVDMYRKSGFGRFVVLIYHEGDSVKSVLGDGSDMGVEITYSRDPEMQVGRGGAILNALMNGSIPPGKDMIVHNPDDQIVMREEDFVRDIIFGHLRGERKGMKATVVVANGTPYHYTGMEIDGGEVKGIEMYPFIPIPTHIGVTIISRDIYACFHELFDLEIKKDFESVMFQRLVKENKLYSVMIPHEAWIPVNDPKQLELLIERL